jgi:hypothetical protein
MLKALAIVVLLAAGALFGFSVGVGMFDNTDQQWMG